MCKFIAVGFAILVSVTNAYVGKRIHFNDIRALTFRKGVYSTSRRLAPVPQLKCFGGPCHEFDINTIQCRNIGHDGQLPQWECKTPDLSTRVKIDTHEVVCEGYEHTGDPYVLHGSCGLEYSLKRVDDHHEHTPRTTSYVHHNSKSRDHGWVGIFLTIAVFAFALHALTSRCGVSSVPENTYCRPDAYNYGYSNYGYGHGRYDYGGSYRRPGGFWTGAGVGGLAGYWAGRNMRSSNRHSSHGWGSSSARRSHTATSFASSRSR